MDYKPSKIIFYDDKSATMHSTLVTLKQLPKDVIISKIF